MREQALCICLGIVVRVGSSERFLYGEPPCTGKELMVTTPVGGVFCTRECRSPWDNYPNESSVCSMNAPANSKAFPDCKFQGLNTWNPKKKYCTLLCQYDWECFRLLQTVSDCFPIGFGLLQIIFGLFQLLRGSLLNLAVILFCFLKFQISIGQDWGPDRRCAPKPTVIST